jgi:hypothetical protein
MSVIGLGTWQTGGEPGREFTRAEVDRLVGRAAELGVNLIDPAECYGDRLAESLVGHAVAHDRGRWIVATKFGHRFHPDRLQRSGWDPGSVRSDCWSPGEVVEQLEASLRASGPRLRRRLSVARRQRRGFRHARAAGGAAGPGARGQGCHLGRAQRACDVRASALQVT